MNTKRTTRTTQLPFDFLEDQPGYLDPLVQKLWGMTEKEFMAIFEAPSTPEEDAKEEEFLKEMAAMPGVKVIR